MARKTHKSPAEARTAILDAAEQIVVDVGSAGLRISAVAKKAGMAHPNVIHHFGSREGLLNALANRVGERATDRITAAISDALSTGKEQRVDALEKVLDTAYPGNEGRAAVWLHLSGAESSLEPNMRQIVELSHELRALVHGDVDIENTHRLVMLVSLALVGEVVSGVAVKSAMGYQRYDDADNSPNSSTGSGKGGRRAHFHRWLAELLLNLSEKELSTSFSREHST